MEISHENKILHNRQSIRLKAYDYSAGGAYYVTICAQNRKCMFGEIRNGQMQLNDVGRRIDVWWRKIFEKYKNVLIDKYVIMPNHIHGIINIVGAIPCNRPIYDKNNKTETCYRGENVVSPLRTPNTYEGLGQFMSWFKRMSTTEYIRRVKNDNWQPFDKRLWQRNYYERVIRNESELYFLRQYIAANPAEWETDPERTNRAYFLDK